MLADFTATNDKSKKKKLDGLRTKGARRATEAHHGIEIELDTASRHFSGANAVARTELVPRTKSRSLGSHPQAMAEVQPAFVDLPAMNGKETTASHPGETRPPGRLPTVRDRGAQIQTNETLVCFKVLEFQLTCSGGLFGLRRSPSDHS